MKITDALFLPTYLTKPSTATLAALTTTLANLNARSNIVPAYQGFFPTQPIVGFENRGNSSYHGLAIDLRRRFTRNLLFRSAYTWSHNLDDATATNFSTYLTPRRAQNVQNLKADWSTSALDRRNRFTFTPIYEFRPFKNGNWLMRNVVGNWIASGTYTFESPEYATVQAGLDSNLNGDSAGDRVLVNPAGQANVGSGVTGYNSAGQKTTSAASIVAYVANNPNAQYVVAGSGAIATGGRNTFPLHPINNFDINMKKRFNLSERRSFDIGAQFYNLFNHAQYTGGFTNDVRSNGFIGARNDLVPSDPLFGRFDQFYSSNSRVVQISAHFTF